MRITLLVGCQQFVTTKETLLKNGPNYFTAQLSGNWKEEEIFIDRAPRLFAHVLSFQQGYTLYLKPREYAMLLQDAEFYAIEPLIAFCKTQLGGASPELLDELERELETTEEAHPLCEKLTAKVQRARESNDKREIEIAIGHLKAWAKTHHRSSKLLIYAIATCGSAIAKRFFGFDTDDRFAERIFELAQQEKTKWNLSKLFLFYDGDEHLQISFPTNAASKLLIDLIPVFLQSRQPARAPGPAGAAAGPAQGPAVIPQVPLAQIFAQMHGAHAGGAGPGPVADMNGQAGFAPGPAE